MTSFYPLSANASRDLQDDIERHVWGEQNYEEQGLIIKVRGTDTKDEEATVLNVGGVALQSEEGHDAEVFLLASSSDTTLKVAILTIPRDKQRRWPEGEGGVQHPTDRRVRAALFRQAGARHQEQIRGRREGRIRSQGR